MKHSLSLLAGCALASLAEAQSVLTVAPVNAPGTLFTPVLLTTPSVHDDWPTEPDMPLVLGESFGGTPEHVLRLGCDGSTWVAWVDGQCFSAVRLQRVSLTGRRLWDGGLVVQTFDDCSTLTPRLAVCTDGTAVVSASESDFTSAPLPVQRFAANGASLWGDGITPDGLSEVAVGALHGLPGGDALVLWMQDETMYLNRYTVAGTAVWAQLSAIESGVSSNFSVLNVHDDGAGGVYLVWDSPGIFTNRILATHVSGDGEVLWPAPVIVSGVPPGSSRHSRPETIEDGHGGLFVVWTEGDPSEGAPVPLRLQHLSADGTLRFEPEGRRVSLLGGRQVDPSLTRNGNDLYIAWRQGVFQVMAQRMTLLGERVWGDSGVKVAPLADPVLGRFDARWHGTGLSLVLADRPLDPGEASIHLHRVDAQGNVDEERSALSGPERASHFATRVSSGALIVTWLVDTYPDDTLAPFFAQRVNPDGTLGRHHPRVRLR